jgi:hypothetical protein
MARIIDLQRYRKTYPFNRVRPINQISPYPTVKISSDYNVDINDYRISVDSSGGTVSVTLPSSTVKIQNGETFIIKDSGGGATTNNITISGNGNSIDGSATYVIANNYASVVLTFNGTDWDAF